MRNTLPPDPANWRPIAGTDKYLVSNDGRVWSIVGGKELRTKVAKVGYVNINLGYGVGTRLVHILVAEAWLGPKPTPGHVVDHKDEDRTNNKASNLEWVTRKENTQRAGKSGTLGKRKRGRKRFLTPEQVYEARKRRADGESYAAIGRDLNTGPSTIRNAVHGVFYEEYTDVPPLPLPPSRKTGAGGSRNVGPQKATDKHPSEFIDVLLNEQWKRLEGSVSGYWVSDQGRVFSAKSRRLKKSVANTKQQGYLRIQLRNEDNGYTSFMLHRLVAEFFLPPPPSPTHIVGHMNEDPTDARASNLCWISRKENAVRAHRFKAKGGPVSELHNFIDAHVEAVHDTDVGGVPVDVLVPSLNAAFRYDDVVLASNRSGVGSRDRLNVQDKLRHEGVSLYYVFSHEWEAKKDVVKSAILSKLGVAPKRVYARKTQVREVGPTESMAFLRENHLQGAVGAMHRYGCYVGEDMVALMTFGAIRYGKKPGYELLRYATTKNTTVVGGFSKLLKHFTRTHCPERIVSFADRRWSFGNVYETNGFSLAWASAPNYFYFRPEDPHTLKSRVVFQKHKLPSLLESFDPKKTEFENMSDNGWDRVWDCGNLVYELSVRPKH